MASAVPKASHQMYFTILFLLFGADIALFTSIVDFKLAVRKVRKDLDARAVDGLGRKRRQLSAFAEHLEEYVAVLRDSPLLHAYLRESNAANQTLVNQLFYTPCQANSSLMQVRYIDARGMKKVRRGTGKRTRPCMLRNRREETVPVRNG